MSDSSHFVLIEDGGALVRFQVAVYGLESILKAAHRMMGACFLHVERDDAAGLVLVRLRTKRSVDSITSLAGDLVNGVLEQTLRDRLTSETEPIRRVLIAQAFSNTSLLHPELESADPSADPLGIGRPDRG